MSFERFSSSDVYIFEHVGGFIQCCGCLLTEPEDGEWVGFAEFKTPRQALAHLDEHEKAGHDIGGARHRILREYELDAGLDTPIQPFKEDEKVSERRRARMKEIFAKQENSQEEKKTHSISEVDRLTAEATVDGYAECSKIVDETLSEMTDAINVVMGIYMKNDLSKYDDRVKELDLIYTTLQSVSENYSDKYFERLDELKFYE